MYIIFYILNYILNYTFIQLYNIILQFKI